MTRINKTTLTLIGFAALSLSAAFAQAPQTTQQPKAARHQAMQRLMTDFTAAIKTLPPDDQQKAQTAIAQLNKTHVKGAPRDPQARHQAMQVVKQMSGSPALRPEDRETLSKDLAALRANHAKKA